MYISHETAWGKNNMRVSVEFVKYIQWRAWHWTMFCFFEFETRSANYAHGVV